MQDTKRFEDRHPAAGPGLSGALGTLRRCGEEEQGGSEGLTEEVARPMAHSLSTNRRGGDCWGWSRLVRVSVSSTNTCPPANAAAYSASATDATTFFLHVTSSAYVRKTTYIRSDLFHYLTNWSLLNTIAWLSIQKWIHTFIKWYLYFVIIVINSKQSQEFFSAGCFRHL